MQTPFLQDSKPLQRVPSRRMIGGEGTNRGPNKIIIERHNIGWLKFRTYSQDIFHTLVNIRWQYFVLIFVVIYLSAYAFFAALYNSQPRHCISDTHNYWHTLWFSVIASATIGFGNQSPNPWCTLLNVILTAQVLTGLLLNAAFLGVVYARFSTPNRRSHTIKFSQIMTMHLGSDGNNRLSFRVANLRQHQVLRPELRLLLLRKQKHGGVNEYIYSDLPWCHPGGKGPLWLGVPTVVKHVINVRSPLYGAALKDMEGWGWEFVVLLDGYDESTSMPIQARQSYTAGDIVFESKFKPVLARRPSGFLGVDFSSFDLTQYAAEGSSEEGDDVEEGILGKFDSDKGLSSGGYASCEDTSGGRKAKGSQGAGGVHGGGCPAGGGGSGGANGHHAHAGCDTANCGTANCGAAACGTAGCGTAYCGAAACGTADCGTVSCDTPDCGTAGGGTAACSTASCGTASPGGAPRCCNCGGSCTQDGSANGIYLNATDSGRSNGSSLPVGSSLHNGSSSSQGGSGSAVSYGSSLGGSGGGGGEGRRVMFATGA